MARGGTPTRLLRTRPSAPGEFPHKVTGTLRNSVGYMQVTPLHFRVGVGVLYGKWLEFGTKTMAARPFLRPTMWNNQSRLAEIMAGRA